MRLKEILSSAKKIKTLSDIDDLEVLLDMPTHKLELIAMNPRYKSYKIPKKNGDYRLIEDPEENLKHTLRQLNQYYQAYYHGVRPSAVYGFCIHASHEPDPNIISHAQRHIGKPYLLNIDLKDFFHQIKVNQVDAILKTSFPKMKTDARNLLTRLSTFKGRLPMGSPTSPILSNYACITMDQSLMNFSSAASMTYTRYADDLSFSSQSAISARDFQIIESIITENQFLINPDKVKHFTSKMVKIVTGLVVGEQTISLPEDYLVKLNLEIDRYINYMQVEKRYQTGSSLKKLKLFEQELFGKLNFASQVLTKKDKMVAALYVKLETAISGLEDYESIDWLDIPYIL